MDPSKAGKRRYRQGLDESRLYAVRRRQAVRREHRSIERSYQDRIAERWAEGPDATRRSWKRRTAALDSTSPARTKVEEHSLIEYAFGDRVAQVSFTNTPAGVKVQVTFDTESTHSVEQQRAG